MLPIDEITLQYIFMRCSLQSNLFWKILTYFNLTHKKNRSDNYCYKTHFPEFLFNKQRVQNWLMMSSSNSFTNLEITNLRFFLKPSLFTYYSYVHTMNVNNNIKSRIFVEPSDEQISTLMLCPSIGPKWLNGFKSIWKGSKLIFLDQGL